MGRVKADGSGPLKPPEDTLVRPAGEAEDTGVAGAAKLFSGFGGTGSLPRPIHQETQRLWRRRWSWTSMNSWTQWVSTPGLVCAPQRTCTARVNGDSDNHQKNESMAMIDSPNSLEARVVKCDSLAWTKSQSTRRSTGLIPHETCTDTTPYQSSRTYSAVIHSLEHGDGLERADRRL